MRESIIQTAINKFLTWLAKKSVTALYKQTHFWTFSWGLDENTDMYLMSEESYHGYHRFGVREENTADPPQTEKPKIRKRIDKPFRAVWLDDDHNEIDPPQTERSSEI